MRRVEDAVRHDTIEIIPSDPFATNWVPILQRVVNHLNDLAGVYVAKYLGSTEPRYLWKVLKVAKGWATERPLSEVIAWKQDIDEAEVDVVLDIVNTVVPFGLPRLLRAVVFAQDSANPILTMVEWGAFNPITKALLDIGIGRELAISVRSKASSLFAASQLENLAQSPVEAVNQVFEELNEWEKMQVTYLGIA